MADEVHGSAHDQNLIERQEADQGGIEDSASWTLRKENGIIVKGPDPDLWALRDEQVKVQAEEEYRGKTVDDLKELVSFRGITPPSKARKDDLVSILIADDTKRPPEEGLPPGYVNEELSMKGPDPYLWDRDAEGNYVNR